MAQATASPASEERGRAGATRRLSLGQRILAVNIFAVMILAGSFFYLDSYRRRLIDERLNQAQSEARLIAAAIPAMAPASRAGFLETSGREQGVRIRIADPAGRILEDNWRKTGPAFRLTDPASEPWQRHVARWLDEAIEFVVDAKEPETFRGFEPSGARPANSVGWTLAPDRTHMIWATARAADGSLVMTDRNARDIRRLVRAERSRLGLIIAAVGLLSALLSRFLARTIALPLRRLARSAVRVRYGLAREVDVGSIASRRDEIGLLARALSDMSHALRGRMDAVESFAADVAHEIKNPLASLASASESLESVSDPAAQAQLKAIISQDVRRLDRLITDISELSRIEGRLVKSRFEPVDVGRMIEQLIEAREARGLDRGVEMAFARPHSGSCRVAAVSTQLERAIEKLIDNAVSFSPEGGLVRIAATRDRHDVLVTVEDEGPGIPEEARETIFERFHSDRPDPESFGEHSGLGLSIARTIVEGHSGVLQAAGREGGNPGARFILRLPAMEDE